MRLVGLALSLIVAAAVVLSLHHSGGSSRLAPALPRTVLSGRPTGLRSLRGQPVLIDFFASWCGPCSAEAPALEGVARALTGRAQLIAIDWSDSASSARVFTRHFHWSFPVLYDPNGAAGYAYGIHGLPTMFVLDGRGRIVERLVGPQDASSLLHAVHAADRRA